MAFSVRLGGWAPIAPGSAEINRGRDRADSSPSHQRATALLERPEGFGGGDRRTQDVEVAGVLRFRRLLRLEQEGIVNLAAVGADGPFAEQRIIGGQLLHLGD